MIPSVILDVTPGSGAAAGMAAPFVAGGLPIAWSLASAVGSAESSAAPPPRLNLDSTGGQRPSRRGAGRVNRSEHLLDNPKKTLFQSDGEMASASASTLFASASAFSPPPPVLNLDALQREVRVFTFCNHEAERVMLRGTQAKLRTLLDDLDTDRWRFESSGQPPRF